MRRTDPTNNTSGPAGAAGDAVGHDAFATPDSGVQPAVVIGMDPHKRSATIDVLDRDEQSLAGGRYSTDTDGYCDMLTAGRAYPMRVWAVEGAGGVGRHLAQRLLADGENVLDVPAKLSAKVRVFSTGNGRKTDATDARSIAVAALRTADLRPVSAEDETVALRLLADHRDQLGVRRTQVVNRAHKLFAELLPTGVKKSLTAPQAKKLLATIDMDAGQTSAGQTSAGQTSAGLVVGWVRRDLLQDLLNELAGIERAIKDTDKRLQALVLATGSHLMDLYGIGPATAARILGDVGDITRFATKGHFASWNGTAPLDVSSGDNNRHRLSRAGNRQLNRALHTMATTQIRRETTGRAFYERKKAEGKSSKEALRALKRRLSDVVYRQLVADTATTTTTAQAVQAPQAPAEAPHAFHDTAHTELPDSPPTTGAETATGAGQAGPGGHSGATTHSSAADSNPSVDASEKSLPGPAHPSSPRAQGRRN